MAKVRVRNGPRARGERKLTETRGRLVEEEKQLRLRSELDTDGDTLACLDVETEARETNHGVRLVLKLEKLDDLFDVGILLCFRDVAGLTKVRREAKSLANGGRRFVDVELLDICSFGKVRSADSRNTVTSASRVCTRLKVESA